MLKGSAIFAGNRLAAKIDKNIALMRSIPRERLLARAASE